MGREGRGGGEGYKNLRTIIIQRELMGVLTPLGDSDGEGQERGA